MEQKKRAGFFQRLTGGIDMIDEEEEPKKNLSRNEKKGSNWMEEENEEAELAVDVYQTGSDIVIQTMVAGVRPEELEITIARDIVTIAGKREESRTIEEDDYFSKELYWGRFSRTISLPAEVEPEEVDATEKHGLLTIKLQKVDKEKKNSVKVKSI